MEGTYYVCFGNTTVGTVEVTGKGLYYRFLCRCTLTSGILSRLNVAVGDHQVDLGILVPENGEFVLDKTIPKKRLGEGTPVFRIAAKHDTTRSEWVPISPEEPFTYLNRLKSAYLVKKEGRLGVCFIDGAVT